MGVYEDPGGSGAYLERPGLDSLREQVAEDGVHFVLAQDRDRFARDPILVGLLRYEFEEHGARLKSIQDAYNDTPEGELTSGILDQIAAYERKQIAKRMWRGCRQRAWEGKIIAGNSAPYGFSFNGNRTNLVVNDSEMFTVRRVFEMAGCRGMSLNAARRALEDDGVLTPRGRREWQRIVLRDMILNDLYRPHTHEELERLVAEGNLSPEVFSRLDPGKLYGVWWYNRVSDRKGPHGKRIKVRPKPRSEWVAVPIPDPGIPRDWADKARTAIQHNVPTPKADGRFWELYGITYCPCGRRLTAYTTRRKNGTVAHYYVCGRRRHDNRKCEYARYHRAEDCERRVRDFTLALVRQPEVIEEQARKFAESERRRLRDPNAQIQGFLEQRQKIDRKRERYLEQHAEGLRSLEDLKSKLADLDTQKTAIDRELASLKDHENYLAGLDEMAEHFVRDLPSWLEGWTEKSDPDPHLYRETYERFGYRIVANKDGTLDIMFGGSGEAHLPPGYERPEPIRPPDPSDPVWDTWKEGDPIPAPTGADVLQKRSVSQRT